MFLKLPRHFAQMTLLAFFAFGKQCGLTFMTDELSFSEDSVTPGRTQPRGIVPGREHNCPFQLSRWSFNSINCLTEIKLLPGTFMQTLHNHNLTITSWCWRELWLSDITGNERSITGGKRWRGAALVNIPIHKLAFVNFHTINQNIYFCSSTQ